MDLECADVLQAKPVRRAAEKATEPGNGVHVGSPGCRRQIAHRHVFNQAATQRTHLGHRGSPVPGLRCSTQTLTDRTKISRPDRPRAPTAAAVQFNRPEKSQSIGYLV